MIRAISSRLQPIPLLPGRFSVRVEPGVVPFLAAQSEKALLVTASGREAEEYASALEQISPGRVSLFPAWETLPHERLSPRADTVARRLTTLAALENKLPESDIIVAPIRALLAPIVRGLGARSQLEIHVKNEYRISELVENLLVAGYSRNELVERRGDFAVRGGILDLFSPLYEHPIRVEFWGDTVEELRFFNVADQRSIPGEDLSFVTAPPCREIMLTEQVRNRAGSLLKEHPEYSEVLEKVAEGISVEGMEAFLPALVDDFDLLIDLCEKSTAIYLCDYERIRTRAIDLYATSQEFLEAAWLNAAAGNQRPVDFGASAYQDLDQLLAHATSLQHTSYELTSFPNDSVDWDIASRVLPTFGSEIESITSAILSLQKQGQTVIVSSPGNAQRFSELLSGAGIPTRRCELYTTDFDQKIVHFTSIPLTSGFIFKDLAVITESELSGQKSSKSEVRRLPSKRRKVLDPLELKPGDYIVHEHHGVGRFIEMVQRNVSGGVREYLVVEYASSKRGQPNDRLFVPTESLDLVSKYVGGEAPTVHRLGGGDWSKAKGRARKAVKEIAGELIRLYAARTSSPGFAFSADTPWQAELESAFPFQETPDQLATINDVKADMEKPIPMDRVVCGDVGYGKTEIAVRAAFKAIQDGKQVALLVPTTLLVAQHLKTFQERYASFPIKLVGLSRFESHAEIKQALAGLGDGSVDLVIGTHRLLSSDVVFKDLGLVIVDEEQRFGVEHKEALKRMRTHVDVLTMSATPIPRTLEMAIAGIREMSTITTPPEERLPILTFVGAYDSKQISAAIRRELLRDGQVFYVHNRVESIDRTAQFLKELVPEARIRVAHGQMHEDLLEEVIVGFWQREFDVLVSTSIIESGIDIANANTLIVERADVMGLSQLHQLRGRVGRARERAYAYFLYPSEKPLTETALDRLRTIAAHTDLGSGMYVAMKDLEIRGAGNLLGGEQSGHIADVGFDLYMRMVGEAVADYRGELRELAECKIDLPIDAHIPHGYIDSQKLRLDVYRRMAEAGNDDSPQLVAELKAELHDRYGEIPASVERLFHVTQIRHQAQLLGLREIALAGKSVRFSPVQLPESAQMRLTRLYPGATYRQVAQTLLLPLNSLGAGQIGNNHRHEDVLAWVETVLAELNEVKRKV